MLRLGGQPHTNLTFTQALEECAERIAEGDELEGSLSEVYVVATDWLAAGGRPAQAP